MIDLYFKKMWFKIGQSYNRKITGSLKVIKKYNQLILQKGVAFDFLKKQ